MLQTVEKAGFLVDFYSCWAVCELCQHVINGVFWTPSLVLLENLWNYWVCFLSKESNFKGAINADSCLILVFTKWLKPFFRRYNQAHKTSGTNFQVHPSKIESLKEEMDEAGNKVEQCKVWRDECLSFTYLSLATIAIRIWLLLYALHVKLAVWLLQLQIMWLLTNCMS